MADRTLTRICATYDEAVQYVYDLERAGVPDGAVSIVGSDTDQRLPGPVRGDTGQNPITVGATIGAVIGGGAGVLAGIGAVVVPGIGPLVAGGWLAATLTGAGIGAVIGGVLGLLVRAARGRSAAHDIATAVDDGQYVVLVEIDEANAPAVQTILQRPLAPAVRDAALHPATPEPGNPETSSSGVTLVTPVTAVTPARRS